MSRREDVKRLDILLDGSLFRTVKYSIEHRGFSLKLRLAAKRLTDSFEDSPEDLAKKLKSYPRNLVRVPQSPLTKRLSVEFSVEDLAKIDRAVEYLKKQRADLNRQSLLRFALLEWPNPK